MGGGDIKLAAMLGLFLGWQQFLLAVFLAAVLALLFVLARKLMSGMPPKARVPFGPFLVYASLIAFVFGSKLINIYLETVELGGIWLPDRSDAISHHLSPKLFFSNPHGSV